MIMKYVMVSNDLNCWLIFTVKDMLLWVVVRENAKSIYNPLGNRKERLRDRNM
ncbi:hypothetical protein FACS1894116_06150 [Betaproteobacteria bacterium]|nr:hypothetical protein FACS1894116_06150 [Betaproteobacteria bacterium]GHT98245.1 hypothetical protein FACS1894154_03220 [Betaproteobacteria bacterium]